MNRIESNRKSQEGIDARQEVQLAFSAHVCREGVGTADPPVVRSETWRHDGRGPIRVDTIFESPRGPAGLYLAQDFVSAEECAELRRRVGPQLIEAGEYASFDPNEEDAKQRLSKPRRSSSRKAQAGTIEPNLADANDPLATLQVRSIPVCGQPHRFPPPF